MKINTTAVVNIEYFSKHKDWIKIWSGKWSLHFDSHQGFWWTKNKSIAGKQPYGKVIYFCENGITDCWVSAKDKDDLGIRLSKQAADDPKYISNISNGLIKSGKIVNVFIDSSKPVNFGLSEFNRFWKIYGDYFVYHISVKYIVDYLSEKQLIRFLSTLEKARLTSEFTTRNAENFLENVAASIAKKTSYTKEMILSTTREELESYFKTDRLPSHSELKKRSVKSSLIVNKKGYEIFSGKKVVNVKKIILIHKDTDIIKGQAAYAGLAKGIARIILNPTKEAARFKKGEIFVTGMTRPEFLPIMHKAAAFVTDAGGILSHAAITAREMKKPCIIGTKVGTKALKDGDLVEVDANKGIVRKIK